MKHLYKLLTALMFLTYNGYSQLISATYGFAQPGPIPKGTMDAPILKLKISVGTVPVVLDSLTWNTAGCTNYASDVIVFSTKIFFTDTDSTFSSAYPSFNSTNGFNGLKFIFPITLTPGDNYLWLTYSVSNTALNGHCLGAFIDSLYINGNTGLNPVYVPATINCIPIDNIPVAINNLSSSLSKINLHPNPTTGLLKIDFPSIINDEFTLKISDCLGHLVFQTSKESLNGNECDLSTLSKGIYVVQITGDGKTFYSKLVKE